MFKIFTYVEFAILMLICFLMIFLILGIIRFFVGYCRKSSIVPSDKKAKFAIIIPARDESKVIEGNLKSIQKTDYPKDLYDIYLILESEDDPTVEIAKKYTDLSIHLFYRVDLSKVGKGYALDECLKNIYSNHDVYDAFMILDADNLVSPNFISRMNDAYQAGYDIACGKRENKDWNASVVCGASALTFSIINTIQNKPKENYGMNVLISGTGFFFKSSMLREYCGWPFHTLTEDYELTNYSVVHHLKSGYVEDAIFYDEQPLKMRQSILQRTRWIKGYFTVQKKYKKEKIEALKQSKNNSNMWYQIIGGIPMIALAVTLIGYLLTTAGFLIYDLVAQENMYVEYIIRIVSLVGAIYLFFVLFTIFLFILDRKTIRIKKWQRIKVIFYHPIFMVSYVHAAIRALFVKANWDKIEHTINNTEI